MHDIHVMRVHLFSHSSERQVPCLVKVAQGVVMTTTVKFLEVDIS